METEAGRSADRSWSKALTASSSEIRQSLPPISSLTDDYGRRPASPSQSRDPRSDYPEQGPSAYRHQHDRQDSRQFPALLGSRQNAGPSSGWKRSDDRPFASDRPSGEPGFRQGQFDNDDPRRPSDGSDVSGPRLPSLLGGGGSGPKSPNKIKRRASPREPFSRESGQTSPGLERSRWARETSPGGDHPGFLRPRSSNSYSRRPHSDLLGSYSEEHPGGGPWPRSADGSPNARLHGIPGQGPFRTRSGTDVPERERMTMMMEEERWNREREQPGACRDWPSSALPSDSRSAHPYRNDPRMEERGGGRRGTAGGISEEPMHGISGYGPPPPGSGPPALPPYASPRHGPYSSSLARPHAYSRGGPPPGVQPMGRPAPAALVAASTAAPVSAPTTASSNRRVAHLLSEQRRRESINTGFEDLRQALPVCRDGQDSKATVLRRAVEYIHELESIIEQTHRVKSENEHMDFDSRSPPNDHEGIGRHHRPGDDRGGRRGTTGSGGSKVGPRIVGVPVHFSRD